MGLNTFTGNFYIVLTVNQILILVFTTGPKIPQILSERRMLRRNGKGR